MNYFERKRREKLYRQWVERAGLPRDALPTEADESTGRQHRQSADSGDRRGALFKPHSGMGMPPNGIGGILAGIDRRLLYGLLTILLVAFWLIVITFVVDKCS